jgi:PQQ-dependent dehydrogenase (s-GDH family)
MKNVSRYPYGLLCLVYCLSATYAFSQTVTFGNQQFKIDTLYPAAKNAGSCNCHSPNDWYGLSFPWELTYGPDDSLWVTEAHGYRIWKINQWTKGARMIADLNSYKDFNIYNPKVGSNSVSGPQGGMEGMAIHPLFLSGKPYVYIVMVYHINNTSGEPNIVGDSGTMSTNNNNCDGNGNSGHPCFYRSKVMRFTYNFTSGALTSPQVMLDGLDGSNDHNSGRLTVSPTGSEADGKYYLYYTIGDMGAGQFNNAARINNAQDKNVYEGKILRLNTEADGDAANGSDPYNNWIPNTNPFTNTITGFRSAVFTYGHRNAQGLVWANVNGNWKLYASEHGDKSDDEVNLLQAGNNYGWPKVAGMCDDNYNDTDGNPNNNLLANKNVHNEHSFCQTHPVTEPVFSFFNVPGGTVPSSGSSNWGWPTIAPSGMDYYSGIFIPGWNNSLLVSSLKNGLYRLKLKADGSGIDSASTPQATDTIAYLHGYRIRDLAIAPSGDSLFFAIDSSGSTSGPTGGFIPGNYVNTPTAGFILRMVYLRTLPLENNYIPERPVENRQYIKVFPNPAHNVLYVQSKKGMYKPLIGQLMDITGNTVKQVQSSNDNFPIYLNGIKPGVYIFKLYNGFGVLITTEKIVVQ